MLRLLLPSPAGWPFKRLPGARRVLRLLPPSPLTDAERLALGRVRERFAAPLSPDDDPIGDSEMHRLRFYRWLAESGRLHDGVPARLLNTGR